MDAAFRTGEVSSRRRPAVRKATPAELAAVFKVSERTVSRMVIDDVLEAMPMERMILVRTQPDTVPQVIKASRVVEAIDVPTGRRVIMERWFAHLARC